MININYNDKSDTRVFSSPIHITTGNLSGVFSSKQLPLKIEIVKSVTNTTIWSTELGDNSWASYPSNEINDVVIKDAQDNFVYRYYWNVMEHGTIFYKSLWLYCKGMINSGKVPNGLVIGTHDGEFGEWVPVVKNFMSNATLIEGSMLQYNTLFNNYFGRNEIHCIHDIITTDGQDVEFFEGGAGYTNSVVERVIRNWEKEEIISTRRTSTSINDLIRNRLNGHIDWLHLDVEGLDARLIMSLEDGLIPNFMIFEVFNLTAEERDEFHIWLNSKNFNAYYENGIGMATKRQ